jgi:polysaccharide pyruvyl transferase WcaK-like protein/2-polyprenyl-3-methyl-5-hydroxy-6-metoxy-1,4-benzoquinol methylase
MQYSILPGSFNLIRLIGIFFCKSGCEAVGVEASGQKRAARLKAQPPHQFSMKRLASVDELNSPGYRAFMAWINGFARVHGLRVHTNWSKIWEYPWVWLRLAGLNFRKAGILDIGSEISPMPWFFASLGAHVTMVETDAEHIPKWQDLRKKHAFDIRWDIVSGSELPYPEATFDLVTSFSVLEHIPDKDAAIAEAIRVLKPEGLFCLTFDICEPTRGMTFPEWNGTAMDMESFDQQIWQSNKLQPLDPKAQWNVEDIDPFLQWHRQTALHHNYAVGGAILRKKADGGEKSRRIPHVPPRIHQLDTGLGSGNTGDDAMFLAAHAHLLREFELHTEVHSLERAAALPHGVRYLDARNVAEVESSIRWADAAVLVGDTPVMDRWGLEWPLQANATKLQLCHLLRKPVHALGIGVDELTDPQARRVFQDYYLPIASWSVRTEYCKKALLDLSVPENRIAVGSDWAWLLSPEIDREWADGWLQECGAERGRANVGVNLVNEIWQSNDEMKKAWAALLDRIVQKHGAQIFFFCNESREGDYFDRAAAEEVRNRMHCRSILAPNRYYRPSEMISLISRMHVTISQRYHFTVFSALADVYPISIERGQKMRGLIEELDLPHVGNMEEMDETRIESELEQALADPGSRLRSLRDCRSRLEARAGNNLSLFKKSLSAGFQEI